VSSFRRRYIEEEVSDAMRILLVEDEEDLALAIKQVLIGEKYVVDWVADGTQAWDYLKNQWTDYTVAIIDWLLPELSGLELWELAKITS
jgi:two-component system, OmpR family, Ni(II)-responsive and/or redox-responsive regulator NrsR